LEVLWPILAVVQGICEDIIFIYAYLSLKAGRERSVTTGEEGAKEMKDKWA
jgi:hypothetical protein